MKNETLSTLKAYLWEHLRSSLWFVPTLIVAGAVVLAMGLIEADALLSRERLTDRWPRLFGVGAEARGLLSAIASSMITVAGVTFSITIVALALASSQYSPRILRNFMRDRANQAVLGVFVGVLSLLPRGAADHSRRRRRRVRAGAGSTRAEGELACLSS